MKSGKLYLIFFNVAYAWISMSEIKSQKWSGDSTLYTWYDASTTYQILSKLAHRSSLKWCTHPPTHTTHTHLVRHFVKPLKKWKTKKVSRDRSSKLIFPLNTQNQFISRSHFFTLGVACSDLIILKVYFNQNTRN